MHDTFPPRAWTSTGQSAGGSDVPAGTELSRVLLQELEHRMRNDLQALLGSIARERLRAADEQSRNLLDAIIGRVACVAGVYELLQVDSFITINLSRYLDLLCTRVAAARGMDGRGIGLTVELISVDTTMDQAALLGMIVNELTTNALKHAFKDGDGGHITVQLRRADNGIELIVADNGRPQPGMAGSGRGLCLVHGLARQAGGTLSCEHDKGTVWRMTFNAVRPVSPATPQQGV